MANLYIHILIKRLDTRFPGAGSFFVVLNHLSLAALRVVAGRAGGRRGAQGRKTGAFGPKPSLEPMASILASGCWGRMSMSRWVLVALTINYKRGNKLDGVF